MSDTPETTETSVFVCSPEPQDEGCVTHPDYDPTDVSTPADVPAAEISAEAVTFEASVPVQQRLPQTGSETGLAFIGVGLVAVGLAALRARRTAIR